MWVSTIIGSLNIRGGVNTLKRRRISPLITKAKADIFLLHETKISSMEDDIALIFWSCLNLRFSYSNLMGRSGDYLNYGRRTI